MRDECWLAQELSSGIDQLPSHLGHGPHSHVTFVSVSYG